MCFNILSNAYKFTPEDGHVTISARQEGLVIIITMADNGVGISREHLPDIFEPFFQGDQGREGSGLGLAIVKAVTNRHYGVVDVRSEPRQGTTFTITMPRYFSDTGKGAGKQRDGIT